MRILSLLITFFLLPLALEAAVPYKVQFKGIQKNDPLFQTLSSASQLIALQECLPETTAALKRRTNQDLPNLIRALHSCAYYNAQVDAKINFECDPAVVNIIIKPGPVYPIQSFQVIPAKPAEDYPFSCDTKPLQSLTLNTLNITLGRPAFPITILNAEDILLNELAKRGYPLASISKREVIADQETKSVTVTLYVLTGPLARFGTTKICGAYTVKFPFFIGKIAWKQGEIYDPVKVAETQNALEESGLFHSIAITASGEVSKEGHLPITIDLEESKHRTIGTGAGYNTQLGLGVAADWEHRNILGIGERIKLEGTFWQNLQEVRLNFIKPNFWGKQKLIWSTYAQHEKTKGFIDYSATLSATLEKKINNCLFLSYGAVFKQLQDKEKEDDERKEFSLIKSPVAMHWNTTKDFLDPQSGVSLNLLFEPSYQLLHPKFAYLISTLNGAVYYRLLKCDTLLLALKAQFGSIVAAKRSTIPASERFYAGSGNTLRGYNYLTVSPLEFKDKEDKKKPIPVGGKSLMIYNVELRWRCTKSFGAVVFYDFGNVYEQPFPQFHHQLLHSIGAGIRYFTLVGPLRFDLAFPLNPRKDLDQGYQFYLSIGQAF